MHLDSLASPLKDALRYRDIVRLNELLTFHGEDLGQHKVRAFLLAEVLSKVDQSTINWFWSTSSTPEQYAHLVDSISTKSATLLAKRDYTFGIDYSFRFTQSGSRRLLLSKDAKRSLFNAIPREMQSSLRIILPTNPEEVDHESIRECTSLT
jgi:hypothetical protein